MVEVRFSCVIEAYLSYMVEMAKDLNVTLDDSMSLCRWILMDG